MIVSAQFDFGIARPRVERPSFLRRSRTLELPASTLEVVRATGLSERLATETRYLSHGEKQSLELAMVLALEPTLVLLDVSGSLRLKLQRMPLQFSMVFLPTIL